MQGWCDSPLTAKGVYDAYKLGQGLAPIEFVGACTSDADRARNTLSIALEARKNERVRKRRGLPLVSEPIDAEQAARSLGLDGETLREQVLAIEASLRLRGCLRPNSLVPDMESAPEGAAQRLAEAESWRPLLSVLEWIEYPAVALDARSLIEPAAEPPVPVRCDPRLREWCFGDLEGEPARRLRNRLFDLFGDDIPRTEQNERLDEIADYIQLTDASGRAENFAAIEERIASFLQDCGRSVEQRGGGNVLVVSHAMLIRAMVFMYARDRVSDPPKIENASLTTVVWEDGAIRVENVGDTAHLGRPRS